MNDNSKHRATVRISSSIWDLLKQDSIRKGGSVNDVIRGILMDHYFGRIEK